jgi:hypothetical protein
MADDDLSELLRLHALPQCLAALIREQVEAAYEAGRRDAGAERLFRGRDPQRVCELILAEAKRRRPNAEITGVEIWKKKT